MESAARIVEPEDPAGGRALPVETGGFGEAHHGGQAHLHVVVGHRRAVLLARGVDGGRATDAREVGDGSGRGAREGDVEGGQPESGGESHGRAVVEGARRRERDVGGEGVTRVAERGDLDGVLPGSAITPWSGQTPRIYVAPQKQVVMSQVYARHQTVRDDYCGGVLPKQLRLSAGEADLGSGVLQPDPAVLTERGRRRLP